MAEAAMQGAEHLLIRSDTTLPNQSNPRYFHAQPFIPTETQMEQPSGAIWGLISSLKRLQFAVGGTGDWTPHSQPYLGSVMASHKGGSSYPALFNVYTDDVSKRLKACNTGCMISNTPVNHNKMQIFSWSLHLTICSVYGFEHDIK